eukprot:TRINITY_DN47191_c0_g1_i1.p1 TRINITY_DN47191_c0_g1~~TRINITY_DN47191_c0_g1_i1.p1  ORF type:complete len:132 (+),score=33.13 TRINITY_DN47191_c0_g1_i1:81-476(+)
MGAMAILRFVGTLTFGLLLREAMGLATEREAEGTDSFSEELMRSADTDEDGRLSLDEFTGVIEGHERQKLDGADKMTIAAADHRLSSMLKTAADSFRKADEDGDGFVSIHEVFTLSTLLIESIPVAEKHDL